MLAPAAAPAAAPRAMAQLSQAALLPLKGGALYFICTQQFET
jgi:hypothetical protein